MQLQIKTLSNEKFTIECQLSDTVRTIKQKIVAQDPNEKHEADAIKLIFSGKILEDSKTLESYSIKEESFLVVVKPPVDKSATTRAPAAPAATANISSSSTPAARPANVPSSGAASTASQPALAPAQSQPARPAGPAGPNVPAIPADSFLSAENREKALRELTEMGFERTQAEIALRASFYNVERATEYLVTGNIPTLPEGPTQQQGTADAAQPETGSEGAAGRRPPVDDLAELSSNPQFLALRQLIQQNPEQLQTLMQTLQANQPELFQLIEQRPQEFLELLNQVDEGDEGEDDDSMQGVGLEGGLPNIQGAPGTVTITLSLQDQQAVRRLEDMGFDRNRVIEAFIACDRNEELAANFLLSSFD